MNTIRNKRLGSGLCIVAAFCALSCIGCVWTMQSATGKQLSGNGNMTVKTFELKDFDAVAVGGSWRVNISQSETFSKIEADENLFEYFDIAVSGKTLRIGTKYEMLSCYYDADLDGLGLCRGYEGGRFVVQAVG